MALGCCSSFKQCSNLGRCVHETDTRLHGLLNFEECLYKENLDKGRNFYTEYNENNRARAEEYKAKTEMIQNEKADKTDKTEKEIIITKTESKESDRTYIEIPNRLFYIGKRGKYNGYTYNLSEEERETLIIEMGKHKINCTTQTANEKIIDEAIDEKERCNSKIIITINEQKYNISNYNHRGLKKETAVKVASYLLKNGINAEIEEINNFTGSKIIKSIEIHKNSPENKNTQDKKKSQKDMSEREVLKGQVSFFDIQKELKLDNDKTLLTDKSKYMSKYERKYVSNFELVKSTKTDRKCIQCGSIIKAGNNEYYTRVCNTDIAPYIENLCIECAREKELKKIS